MFEAIQFLDNNISNKTHDLPDEIFYFISRTTPLVNVDLLIRNRAGKFLLSWRDDEYAGRGWHIPGGIVRFKETLEQRIQKTAEQEIGITVQFYPIPLTIEQLIVPNMENRAHHISFLYKCTVPDTFVLSNSSKNKCDPGYLEWHDTCPINLIKIQECYRKYVI
jgi:colanic acid biosynthesis protein WcaH